MSSRRPNGLMTCPMRPYPLQSSISLLSLFQDFCQKHFVTTIFSPYPVRVAKIGRSSPTTVSDKEE
ncbi:hypothetical protein ACTXT7_002842 [Hymenolepis weldensis]